MSNTKAQFNSPWLIQRFKARKTCAKRACSYGLSIMSARSYSNHCSIACVLAKARKTCHNAHSHVIGPGPGCWTARTASPTALSGLLKSDAAGGHHPHTNGQDVVPQHLNIFSVLRLIKKILRSRKRSIYTSDSDVRMHVFFILINAKLILLQLASSQYWSL